jgi:hypothetical protein
MNGVGRGLGVGVLAAGFIGIAGTLQAACVTPSGEAGSIKYNSAKDAYEYCNAASTWSALGYTLRGPVSLTGTSVEFLNIPPTASRITVMMLNFSTNGTSQAGIQLGDSGGYEATGYVGVAGAITNGNVSRFTTSTALFPTSYVNDNGYSYISTLILTRGAGNGWSVAGGGYGDAGHMSFFSGEKELSGILDRIQLTATNGTDSFDAGTVSVLIE